MRPHTPYMTIAARALARALRLLALPLAFAAGASAQPADPADPNVEPLSFVPCNDAPGLDCGRLTVPVTYGQGSPSPFIGLFLSAGGGDDGIVARLCNDYGTRRTARDYLPLVEAVGAVHPRFFDRDQLLGDAALCAAWPPADPPAIVPSAAGLDVPVLTLHAQFDSDAPFAWGPRLAHAMGDDRHVVRYLGGGHGVIQRQQPCVRDTVNAYLFDLQLPKEGLACPAEVGPPAAGAFASPSLARPLGGFAQSEAPVRLKRQRR